MYGAVLFRKREQDFGEVRHVDGVSEAWPISYADLEPYYTRAEQLYHVHGERKVDPVEPWASGPFPYPAMSHEPRVEQLSADLERAGLHPFHLPLGIMIDEGDPARSPCIRCDTCDGFPCLLYAKADAQVVCVEPALQYPNVTLRTNAYVDHLETAPDGRRVSKVVVRARRRARGVHRRCRGGLGRCDQLRRTAPAVGQRASPRWARQRLGRGRPPSHAAQQLGR